MSSWKESMINRLSNLINRNRSAAKISQVLCSIKYLHHANCLQKFTLNMSHKERFPYHSSFCTFFLEKALFGNKYPKYFICSFKKVSVFFIEKAKTKFIVFIQSHF